MPGPARRISVLLVEDDPDYATLVQRWLDGAGHDHEFVLSWTESLSSALGRLARGGIDIILLDLGLPDSGGIETFLTLRSRCSGVPVIVLSSADSEALALETIRYGGEDYQVKSTCTRELLIRNISHAMARFRRQADAQTPDEASHKVVAVVGAKGGTGATTVACTLAAELRRQNGDTVLLADLDTDSGIMAFLLGVNSRFSILDAVDNAARLDHTFWQSLVTDVGGVHVVPSPGLAQGGGMDVSNVFKVIEFAKRLYSWVVLDLGKVRRENLALLERANDTLLVTTDSVGSLHEAKRAIEVLCATGVERENVHLLVNRADQAADPLPTSDLVKLFGIEVCGRMPYERDELASALMERRLPAESSAFRSNIRNVARKLAGLEDLKRKGVIPGLVSFLTGTKRRETGVPEAAAASARFNA